MGYNWTVLVGKERKTGAIMAPIVPQKGGRGMFAVERCIDFIDEVGDSKRDILVKSDTEEAMRILMRCVKDERLDGKTVVEEAPKKVKGSNGIVERAVQEIEGRIRAILLSLEERMKKEIHAQERIVAFIPAYAAYLYNRLHRGDDGKVAYERIKGKKPSVVAIEFGEKVLYRKGKEAKLEKIRSDRGYGIFVGINGRSNEYLIATEEGIKKSRSVRRLVKQKTWGEDNLR
eukprot:11391910-Karenia_brevis.AAC.1